VGDTRTCDNCGTATPRPQLAPVKVKAAGKANVYLPATFYWCPACRRDRRGTWKHHR